MGKAVPKGMDLNEKIPVAIIAIKAPALMKDGSLGNPLLHYVFCYETDDVEEKLKLAWREQGVAVVYELKSKKQAAVKAGPKRGQWT